jgi:5-methylcytosine-specific restriction enzyme A
MPNRPKPYCRGRQRRCPKKAVINGLCQEHHDQAERETDARRPNAAARGYDARWRETRRVFLLTHVYCESDDCLAKPEWYRPQATDVDHRDGLGPKGPRGHDPANLRALCHSCHSKRTARDQGAGWNRGRRRMAGGGNEDESDER